jgi:hypothetical protein
MAKRKSTPLIMKPMNSQGRNDSVGSLRQLGFEEQFRISVSNLNQTAIDNSVAVEKVSETIENVDVVHHSIMPRHLIELANSLWYLKTKYFKRAWTDTLCDDDDPRSRRALSRINKAVDSLADLKIIVTDPIGTRYAAGGQAMISPIQFIPTEGISDERISEVIAPVIFASDDLIQRGQVFVSVPLSKE